MLSFYWVPLIMSFGVIMGMVLASMFAVEEANDPAEKEFRLGQRKPPHDELRTGHC